MEGNLSELSFFATLALGVILGLRHALDPDHLVAVSTIVCEYRNPLRAFWIGFSWGLGHTTTLLLFGVVFIALRLNIPDGMVRLFEALVGIMLIGLGAQVIFQFRKKKTHQHVHVHDKQAHSHFHSHAQDPDHDRRHHNLSTLGKPFFRKKSYFVGTVHGFAGSAALALLVLASMQSPLAGIAYILVFGMGSLLGMGIMTVIISLPFVFSAIRLPNLNLCIQFSVGALSILFGCFMIYRIFLPEGFF